MNGQKTEVNKLYIVQAPWNSSWEDKNKIREIYKLKEKGILIRESH
jgi:hypothetical protein